MELLKVCVPILVALIGIIPTIIANRKKTQESIDTFHTEVKKDVTNAIKEVISVKEALDDHIKSDDEWKAQEIEARHEEKASMCRTQILRFNDEIKKGENHTEEHFNNILEAVDFYEDYCSSHPLYPNTKAVMAIANIKRVYQKCIDEDNFL